MMILLMTVGLLTGCGSRSKEAALSDKIGEIKGAAEGKDNVSDDKADEGDSIEKGNTEKDIEDEDEDESAGKADAAPFAEDFDGGIIDNNGSYFVRIGNKVYFRDISPDSMEEGAQFGHFLSNEQTPVKCPLIRYDLDTCKWEEIGDITGTGKLFACPDGFYIQEMEQDGSYDYHTKLYDPVSNDTSVYCKGKPLGVSKSGELLAVEQYGGQNIIMSLVRDGEEKVQLGGEGQYYGYCGFAGEDLIVLHHNANDEFILCSVNEDGEVTELGQVGAGQTSYPELQQFVSSRNDIYLTFGYFEGTGHFLAYYETLKALPGKKGSLEKADVFDDGYHDYTEDEVPAVCFESEGAAFYMAHPSYEAYMGRDDKRNNLYYYNDIYDECLIVKDFIKNDYGDECQIIQDMTTTYDTVFVIYADAKADSEYDIGWRTGYRMTGWHIVAVPKFDTGNGETDIIYFNGESDDPGKILSSDEKSQSTEEGEGETKGDSIGEEETIPEYLLYVNSSDGYANLRTGPGVEYDVIRKLHNGEELEVYREDGYDSKGKRWLKVAYFEGDDEDYRWITGWIAESLVN